MPSNQQLLLQPATAAVKVLPLLPKYHLYTTTLVSSNTVNGVINNTQKNIFHHSDLNHFYRNVTVHYVRVFATANLSVVCNICALWPYSGVETFRNISSPFCTLAILWPPRKILRRSFHGEPSIWSVKCKMVNKMLRCCIQVSHLLTSSLCLQKFIRLD